MSAWIHPDLILVIASVFVWLTLARIYQYNDSTNNISVLAPVGMGILLLANLLNYLEETPLEYLFLALYTEQQWDVIIPVFGYGPGAILTAFAFYDWDRAMRQLEKEVIRRQKVEKELEKALKAANQASEAKSFQVASVSHELRTPLNAIIGFSALLDPKSGVNPSQEKCAEYGRIIHDSGTYLSQIIDDVIDLSKVEQGKMELNEIDFSPMELADECLHLVRMRADESDITLRGNPDSDQNLLLLADQRLVKQSILNLYTNALKFTPAGGTITTHVHTHADGAVSISVTDTGIGITKEDLPRVLEPFSQIKNRLFSNNDGIGIGLPLVNRFMKLHGGRVDIESEIDKGTTVSLVFPAWRDVTSAFRKDT